MEPTESTISQKEWLDLAWKYFQQHAQQRVSYFNFFVIFSTILTTGFLSTFQTTYKLYYLGIPIGLIQAFVSLIFLKIDLRNKFLTQNAEEIIKGIESDFDTSTDKKFSLFTIGEQKTKNAQKKKTFFLFKQWSHGQIYFLFYVVFGITGLAMATFSFSSKLESNITPNYLHRNSEIIINQPEMIKIEEDTCTIIPADKAKGH